MIIYQAISELRFGVTIFPPPPNLLGSKLKSVPDLSLISSFLLSSKNLVAAAEPSFGLGFPLGLFSSGSVVADSGLDSFLDHQYSILHI